MNKIELLAPAGDYDCFLAAINAGADAVYLSGEKFGARAYAKNFSTDELIKAIDYSHLFGRKVFLTVNTLLKDDELEQLYDYLYPFYIAGLDGVIVQDMGVITYIRNVFPDMPVHASTQLTITGIEGINLLNKLGVKRVVLAREVSLSEIEYIINNSDMEIETFVHGALCYSYSGKCLFSSLVGGRSGNRGRCAGSCRQPYNDDKYLLSTKDICCLPILPELINSGIVSLKIEGRMKSPEYVAGVTAMYRKYIDLYYLATDNKISVNKEQLITIKKSIFSGKSFENDLHILTSLYTRGGNSLGYYKKHNGKDMISITDASYKSDKGEIKDNITEVYIDNSLKLPINASVHIRPNENISILINNIVYTEGALADFAVNKPTDIDTVRKQLNKTKDSEFIFNDIDYDISDNAFVRVSQLNELRRVALAEYKEYLLSNFRRQESSINKGIVYNGILIKGISHKELCNEINKLMISCDIAKKTQLETVLSCDGVNRIYIPYDLFAKNKENILIKAKECDIEVYIKFQSVIRYNYLLNNKKDIIDTLKYVDGVLVDSHEVIDFLYENSFNKPIIGDIHIYALNEAAALVYKNLGVSILCVPIELNKKELLRRNQQNEELIVYGYLPMMVSAQCVNSTVSGCTKKYNKIKLTDRKGASFTAVNDCSHCMNTIYNNVPLSLHGEEDFIKKLNPSSLRLVFTFEDDMTTEKIVHYFTNIFSNLKESKPSQTIFTNNTFTKGHLNRGVI